MKSTQRYSIGLWLFAVLYAGLIHASKEYPLYKMDSQELKLIDNGVMLSPLNRTFAEIDISPLEFYQTKERQSVGVFRFKPIGETLDKFTQTIDLIIYSPSGRDLNILKQEMVAEMKQKCAANFSHTNANRTRKELPGEITLLHSDIVKGQDYNVIEAEMVCTVENKNSIIYVKSYFGTNATIRTEYIQYDQETKDFQSSINEMRLRLDSFIKIVLKEVNLNKLWKTQLSF
jgi:hypothetical protein